MMYYATVAHPYHINQNFAGLRSKHYNNKYVSHHILSMMNRVMRYIESDAGYINSSVYNAALSFQRLTHTCGTNALSTGQPQRAVPTVGELHNLALHNAAYCLNVGGIPQNYLVIFTRWY